MAPNLQPTNNAKQRLKQKGQQNEENSMAHALGPSTKLEYYSIYLSSALPKKELNRVCIVVPICCHRVEMPAAKLIKSLATKKRLWSRKHLHRIFVRVPVLRLHLVIKT